MPPAEVDTAAGYVAHHLRHELTPIESALVELVCDAFGAGPYDLKWSTLQRSGDGASWSTDRDLSTFDGDALSRLVVLAHDRCLRVSVVPGGVRHVQIRVYQRVREGSMSRRHPTIEQAIERIRPRPTPVEVA